MKNKFLKATVMTTVCLCGFAVMAHANPNFEQDFATNILDAAQAQAKMYKPVWKSLYTCTPARTSDGALIVYGRTNTGKCAFKFSKYSCSLPLGTNKEYAAAAIKSLEDIEQGTLSTSSPENEYMDKIHNNPTYCKSN